MKPSNVNEAMRYLSKENEKYQHPFFPSEKSNEKCEICENDKNLHIKHQKKLPLISSNNSSISSIKYNHSQIIPITVLSKIRSRSYECKICFNIIPNEQALKNECHNCNTYFCDECLYLDLKESIKNGKYELYCPECKIIYDEEKIIDILSDYSGNEEEKSEIKEEKNELINLYKKNKFKHQILTNNLIFCPMIVKDMLQKIIVQIIKFVNFV